MINAVIYARYSSSGQREESIEGQLRECHDFAERNGFNVVEEYCDRALSGRTDKRDSFQRMISDAEKGMFQAIIVYTLDRFARNRYDSAIYKAKLRKNGVKVYYATGSIPDSPEGIILESVMEGYAEYYSENLSRNVKRGMNENALQCKSTGHLCLGYVVGDDHKYKIDPVESKIVRDIFEKYDEGYTLRQIAEYCNSKGYKTKQGKKFALNSFNSILRNTKYIGIYSYGEVEIEGGMPVIIDKDLFNRVQTRLKTKVRAKSSPNRPDFILTSKLFCGRCGSNMLGESGTSRRGKIYYYYKCINRKRGLGCKKEMEKKEYIEDLVIRTTLEKVLTDENIEKIATKTMEYLDREQQDTSMLVAYENELKEVQGKIKNIIDSIELGIFNEYTKDRIDELDARAKELTVLIANEKIPRPTLTKERIIYWLTSFKYGNIDDMRFRRKVVDTLVNNVYIYDDPDGKGRKIVITYNTSDIDSTELAFEQEPSGCTKKVDIRRVSTFLHI